MRLSPSAIKRIRAYLITLATIAITLLVSGTGAIQSVEMWFTTARFRVRGERPVDPRIKIIGIDEESINTFNDPKVGIPYPFPRSLYGKLVDRLTAMGVKVINFDIYFTTEPFDPQEDVDFAAAIKRAISKGVIVVLASGLPLAENKSYTLASFEKPTEAIMASGCELGLANTAATQLSWRDREQAVVTFQGGKHYSQAAEIVKLMRERDGKPFVPADFGIDRFGTLSINYAGLNRHIPTEPIASFFQEELNPVFGDVSDPAAQKNKRQIEKRLSEEMKGAIVFVGSISDADHDFFTTPFGKMYGVETNASALNTMLRRDFVKLPRPWTSLVLMILVAFLAGHLAYEHKTKRSLLLWAGATVGLVAAFFAVFAWANVLMSFTFTILSLNVSYFGVLAYKLVIEEREKAQIRATFSKYVSAEIVRELVEDPEKAGLGGVDREAAVLFADIRNFSPISERLQPQEILRFVNTYLDSTSEIIMANRGFVDKFMGDGIMAIFGAPVASENPSADAVKAAVEMIRNLRENVHPKLEALGVPKFFIGIGIHFGHVVMGNIGSAKRMDYTVIGDAVNLASRLEGTTKKYKTAIIVSDTVVENLKGDSAGIQCEYLDEVTVKGRTTLEKVYKVVVPDEPDLLVIGNTDYFGTGLLDADAAGEVH